VCGDQLRIVLSHKFRVFLSTALGLGKKIDMNDIFANPVFPGG